MPQSAFAVRALGLYPTRPELERTLEALGFGGALTSPAALEQVAEALGQSLGQDKRGLHALPYAWRGLSLGQLKQLAEGLAVDDWWRSTIAAFNAEHAVAIEAGTTRAQEPNLYALDAPFVRATTSTDARAGKPMSTAIITGFIQIVALVRIVAGNNSCVCAAC